METVIARGVVKRYGAETVLRGIDLTLREGEVVTIRGRSGSGKTTLCRLLTLLDRPDEGALMVLGLNAREASDDEASRLRLEKIGYVDQYYTLIPWLTVFKNVELPLTLLGIPRSERVSRVREVLEMLGLGRKLDSYPHQLSGGERQRVAIARAIVKRPRLIVADEPFSSLDDETSSLVAEVFRRMAREDGCAVLITTTDLSLSLGSRTYMLKRGCLVQCT